MLLVRSNVLWKTDINDMIFGPYVATNMLRSYSQNMVFLEWCVTGCVFPVQQADDLSGDL